MNQNDNNSMSPVALTSRWVAASRALETEKADGLFKDPYARALAGKEGFDILEHFGDLDPNRVANEPNPYLSIRTRYIDDALLHAVNESKLTQVVILAAGMDARAFRLDWPSSVTLFELDRDEVFDYKEKILDGMGAKPACVRNVVRADLETEWITALTSAGFDAQTPAAFLVEGLLPYLDDAAVAMLLPALKEVAAPGSWLVADTINSEFLTTSYMQPMLQRLQNLGCPWRFGHSDPEALFAQHGWQATFVMPGEPEANYGRWPYPTMPRSMPGIPRSYLVTAVRMVP